MDSKEAVNLVANSEEPLCVELSQKSLDVSRFYFFLWLIWYDSRSHHTFLLWIHGSAGQPELILAFS